MFSRDPNAASLLSRHADSIREYIQDPEIDRGEIERWIDHVLCLEDNIDQHQPYEPIDPDDEPVGPDLAELDDQLDELELSEEVRRQVFDEEWLDDQRDDDEAITFPEEPERDILAFLREHGRQYDPEAGKAVEMADWQEEIIEILRREAYYFAPQKMTKVLNEGWACVAPDTPVFSSDGLVEMQEVVEQHTPVSDGDETQAVYDSNIIEGHDTVTVETRRGFELTGSNNHRIRRPDGSWVRLDELSTGETIEVSGGNGVWPDEYVALDWDHPDHVTLDDVAEAAGVSVWTVIRYRKTGRAERADAIERELAKYDADDQGNSQRETIRIPDQLDEQFGRFLGLFVGDGHLPSNSRHIGFTSGSRDRAEEFAGLTEELFGVEPTVSEQGSRWRVYAYSKNLMDFLTDVFDIPAGDAAHKKEVPDQIRRSPKSVVAEFIRGLMDADGYAGDAGAILSTKSEPMSRQVQLLLTNFGILSRRREQSDGCYHVHLTGKSAELFAEQIGFGYDEKTDALRSYLDDLAWFENESWTDEIVSITEGSGTVYDISVESTHRYAAAGLINHNSYWESLMMADENFAGADEFVTYADHMSKVLGSGGLNPYSLGLELWEYVENTENRRHVVEQLLRVEGITWRNFHDTIDFEQVLDLLEPDDRLRHARRRAERRGRRPRHVPLEAVHLLRAGGATLLAGPASKPGVHRAHLDGGARADLAVPVRRRAVRDRRGGARRRRLHRRLGPHAGDPRESQRRDVHRRVPHPGVRRRARLLHLRVHALLGRLPRHLDRLRGRQKEADAAVHELRQAHHRGRGRQLPQPQRTAAGAPGGRSSRPTTITTSKWPAGATANPNPRRRASRSATTAWTSPRRNSTGRRSSTSPPPTSTTTRNLTSG
ncbi:hypothetical protein BRC73_09020 [Halobacteriales archaeon QH_7_66_37]|nr:MAG: hypothetical protein BRC73_09020 [Halobacteriales archaeon QH_7_66_37]